MKNLFFALAFMFIGSFAFANNTTTEVLNTNTIELTEVTSQEVATDVIVVVIITEYYDEDGELEAIDIEIHVWIIE
ncbi:hypothetical protein H2O64_08790 [Kordia sp. YSTF-M3]|uniref:Secreted protein n=1 Tax=Kordia aestuariivivens TaxID=2759037 RepID=A0ABR7Q884_9FLAO|nr:hypothetical protein [Kordia aestuariivivens]MBC8754765.1 hypothetical protein [Kordia aestuariivivens]